jgi:hypothetical protein
LIGVHPRNLRLKQIIDFRALPTIKALLQFVSFPAVSTGVR